MFLYYINWKFQASYRLLRLHSPMCAGNPEDRFYRDTAHISLVSKLVLGRAYTNSWSGVMEWSGAVEWSGIFGAGFLESMQVI